MSNPALAAKSSNRYEIGDWLLYLLLVLLAICLPLVIDTVGWVPDAGQLIWVSLLATVAGILLSLSPLPGWMNWIIGTGWGAVASIQMSGRVLPSSNVFLAELRDVLTWLFNLLVYHQVAPLLPFSHSVAFMGDRIVHLVTKVGVWYSVVSGGGTSLETLALLLGIAFGTWLLTFFACTELLWQRRTFLATIPLGVAIVLNVAYTGIGITYVYAYLGITLIVQVWANARHLERGWKQSRTDFSPEIKRDLLITGGGLSIAIILISLLFPYFTLDRVVLSFWKNVGSRLNPFYQGWDRAFAGRKAVPTLTPAPVAGDRGSHLLSVAPGELGQRDVLIVQTSDPPPPPEEQRNISPDLLFEQNLPKHYWRQITYDTYTGNGWENNSQAQSVNYNAQELWSQSTFTHTLLTQTYTIVLGSPILAFAVNQPSTVNASYRVTVRANGDLESLGVITSTYTVVSWVPDASNKQLQAAEGDYPDWVAQRYLPLPEIPQRIREKAERVVREAGAVTRYDKAKAIEQYLRGFVYDLQIPPPPLGTDVTDYFLFIAQRGYCDYSATAMVVMLRAVGVASRYASGYHMGRYDRQLRAYVVTEASAHAWTEVYFPEYGWIEFEPTPTLTPFYHLSYDATHTTTSTGLVIGANTGFRISPLWYGLIGLVIVLAFIIIWPPRYFKRRTRSAQQQVLLIYEELVAGSAWLGIAPSGGQTPVEFLDLLAMEMETRVGATGICLDDIHSISRTYLQARYSNQPLELKDVVLSQGAWRRLRGQLVRMLLRRAPRKPTPVE